MIHRLVKVLTVYFFLFSRNNAFVKNKYSYVEPDKFNTKKYFEAKRECEDLGMSLPIINSAEENQELGEFLVQNGINGYIWLGLRLPDSSVNPADYVWLNGTNLSWTNWGYTFYWDAFLGQFVYDWEPNSLNTDKCVNMYPTAGWEWFTRWCDWSYRYVCQAPRNLQSPPANTGRATLPMNGGGYFKRLDGLHPSGLSLSLTRTTFRCAARCLQDNHCGIVYVKDNDCYLNPPAAVIPSAVTSLTETIYQKISSLDEEKSD